jgi:hypothetical protein
VGKEGSVGVLLPFSGKPEEGTGKKGTDFRLLRQAGGEGTVRVGRSSFLTRLRISKWFRAGSVKEKMGGTDGMEAGGGYLWTGEVGV